MPCGLLHLETKLLKLAAAKTKARLRRLFVLSIDERSSQCLVSLPVPPASSKPSPDSCSVSSTAVGSHPIPHPHPSQRGETKTERASQPLALFPLSLPEDPHSIEHLPYRNHPRTPLETLRRNRMDKTEFLCLLCRKCKMGFHDTLQLFFCLARGSSKNPLNAFIGSH